MFVFGNIAYLGSEASRKSTTNRKWHKRSTAFSRL